MKRTLQTRPAPILHNTRGLTPGVVAITSIALDVVPVEVVLHESEQQRADRFVFERDRRRFVTSHTALRVVLGRYLESDPRSLRFIENRYGKPSLAESAIDLRFNLSHSGERALLAVALGREVGIDIEEVRPMTHITGVAGHVFSPPELARLDEAPGAVRDEIFFRLWTRKESFIKARGDGFSFPLKSFSVSAAETGSQLLVACTEAPAELGRWTMQNVPCEAGYAAAVTVEGGTFQLEISPYTGLTARLDSRASKA